MSGPDGNAKPAPGSPGGRLANWRLFLVVTGIALIPRLAHVLVMTDPLVNPLFTKPIMDAAMHDLWARGILAGSWPGDQPFFRAPLFIYLLAGLYAIFGVENRLAVQVVIVAISACGAGLAAVLAAHCFSRRAGWLAGLILAASWTSIYFAGELLIATLTTTLNLLLLWLLVRQDGGSIDPPPQRQLLGVGLTWGLSAIARPNILILAPVIIWYLFRYRGLRRAPLGWLALVAGLVLPILPVTAHNLVSGHDTVLIASQGGVNFYIGNNPYSDGRTAYVPGTRPTWQGGFDDVIAMAQRETGIEDLKPSGVDRHFLGKGLSFWFQEPGRALGLYAHKLRLLFAMGERSNNKNIYFWRDRSQVLRWPVWLGWTPVLVLAVLAYFRRDLMPARRFLLLGAAVAYALSIYLFFINARFRLPVLAMLAVAAGGGLDRLVAAWPWRRWPDPRRGLGVAAIVLVFSVLPDLLAFTEDDIHADPFSWFTVGNSHLASGRLTQARHAYERAIDISQRYPQRHFYWIQENLHRGLAQVLTGLGRPEQAEQVYRDYIAQDPATVEVRVELGELLMQRGETDAAAAQFEVALRQEPDHYGAQLGHAWILLNNGEAGAALRRFLDLNRRQTNPQALFGAGMAQVALNRLDAAEKTFLQVLDLQPSYWQALGNLAGLYDQMGRLDEAASAYRRLLAQNPQDARARRWLQEHGR